MENYLSEDVTSSVSYYLVYLIIIILIALLIICRFAYKPLFLYLGYINYNKLKLEDLLSEESDTSDDTSDSNE